MVCASEIAINVQMWVQSGCVPTSRHERPGFDNKMTWTYASEMHQTRIDLDLTRTTDKIITFTQAKIWCSIGLFLLNKPKYSAWSFCPEFVGEGQYRSRGRIDRLGSGLRKWLVVVQQGRDKTSNRTLLIHCLRPRNTGISESSKQWSTNAQLTVSSTYWPCRMRRKKASRVPQVLHSQSLQVRTNFTMTINFICLIRRKQIKFDWWNDRSWNAKWCWLMLGMVVSRLTNCTIPWLLVQNTSNKKYAKTWMILKMATRFISFDWFVLLKHLNLTVLEQWKQISKNRNRTTFHEFILLI